MKYRKFFATTVAILATAAAASAAQVTVDTDTLRKIIQEEIAKAVAVRQETPMVVLSADVPTVVSEAEVANPLSGPGPDVAEADQPYAAYAAKDGSTAAGSVKIEQQGDTLVVTPPSRGLTVTAEQLAAKTLTIRSIVDGKVVNRVIPRMIPGKTYRFDWKILSLEDLFELVRLDALQIVMLGTNNMEEALVGKPQDGPVKTTAVLRNVAINENYDMSGTLTLVNTRAKKVISEKEIADFQGIVYWVQVRCPVDVAVTDNYVIHHKSAQHRTKNYVVPKGELFTLFLGGRESVLGKDNGSEACVPVHPARQVR